MKRLFLPLSLTAAALLPAAAQAATLRVTVQDVHSDQGAIRVVLYRDPQTFRHEEKSLAIQATAAKTGAVTVEFPGLDAGTYAVIAYHDENGNGALDKFLGMIPTEGWALSREPEVTGPPAFEASAFPVTEEDAAISMKLRY